MQSSSPQQPPTTYALVLRHAGRLYDVGDVIEMSDAAWRVAEITVAD